MNALVDPSLTDSIRPRMSSLTVMVMRSCVCDTASDAFVDIFTLKLELFGRPALLQRHDVRHSLTAATRLFFPKKVNDTSLHHEARQEKGQDRFVPATPGYSECRTLKIGYLPVCGIGSCDHSPGVCTSVSVS